MDLIQAKTSELIQFIRKGEIYIRYSQAQAALAQREDLKKWIDEFRVRMYRINNESSETDLFDEVDVVEREYRELNKIPLVNEFLAAELDLCKLLKTVEMEIHRELDFSIPKL